MADPFFHAQDVSVIYNQSKPNEVRSLQGVTVSIYPQEYLIIFGPSGCGKSTLLYSLAALQAPTAGDILVHGKAFSKMTEKEKLAFHRTGMGMIFQAFFLIPSLTIIDNVCLPRVFLNENRKTRREEGMKLLERFGIKEQAFKYPSELSGGQKQRVSIARALVNNPDVIFADEPVGNLDSVSARNVLEILKELNEVDKKTIILVTHDAHHLTYGDRILHMRDGKLLNEEINKDKRSPVFSTSEEENASKDESKAKGGEVSLEEDSLSAELRMLAHSFKGLTQEQSSALLVPFKVKQLIFHILSEINEEQEVATEDLLKRFLFNAIDLETLEKYLDRDIDRGGAGWHKKRVKSFVERVAELSEHAHAIGAARSVHDAAVRLQKYLEKKLAISIDPEQRKRMTEGIEKRLRNGIDRIQLAKFFDKPVKRGGVGLRRGAAESAARELEIMMLLKY